MELRWLPCLWSVFAALTIGALLVASAGTPATVSARAAAGPLEILSFTPTAGRAGTVITITGRGATPNATIEFGGATRSTPAGCAGGRIGGQGSPDPFGRGTADGSGNFAIAFKLSPRLRTATMIEFRASEVGVGGAASNAVCFDITDSDYTFPETGKTIRGDFRLYWDSQLLLGLPLSDVFTETLEDGQPHQVQYFEFARLEYHVVPPYDFAVLIGQLGRKLRPADPPVPPAAGAVSYPDLAALPPVIYFPTTGHNITRREFSLFWISAGGRDRNLELFGYPLGEERDEVIDGRTIRVQYFERARFEWHPEAPEGQRVQISPLGRIACGDRCR